ncbi:hypothetical protein LXL04_034801 [Taraxacum kok-saghyz]
MEKKPSENGERSVSQVEERSGWGGFRITSRVEGCLSRSDKIFEKQGVTTLPHLGQTSSSKSLSENSSDNSPTSHPRVPTYTQNHLCAATEHSLSQSPYYLCYYHSHLSMSVPSPVPNQPTHFLPNNLRHTPVPAYANTPPISLAILHPLTY